MLFSGIAGIGLGAAPNKGLPENAAASRTVMTPRIASLVPSLTELLFELGLGPWLVARTGFCIHPRDAVAGLPKVGGTKDVNLAKLRRLAPTHVLVNIDENRRETVDAIRAWAAADGAPAPQILVTHPLAPDDNLALIDQLLGHFGGLDGVRERAERLRSALRDELDQTRPDGRALQRVLYLIWRDPWMTVCLLYTSDAADE